MILQKGKLIRQEIQTDTKGQTYNNKPLNITCPGPKVGVQEGTAGDAQEADLEETEGGEVTMPGQLSRRLLTGIKEGGECTPLQGQRTDQTDKSEADTQNEVPIVVKETEEEVKKANKKKEKIETIKKRIIKKIQTRNKKKESKSNTKIEEAKKDKQMSIVDFMIAGTQQEIELTKKEPNTEKFPTQNKDSLIPPSTKSTKPKLGTLPLRVKFGGKRQ